MRLFILAICGAAAAIASPACGCPALGVIRWDAWFGDRGPAGAAVERSLGPERFHDRLPTCAKVLSSERVRIDCESPTQMAQEIDWAADAGIGFWAFVAYDETDAMSLGLRTYLAAANRQRVGFAMIVELSRWSDRHMTDRLLRLMREPGYQRTPDGRPTLFLGFASDALIQSRYGGLDGLDRSIDDFREQATRAGLPRPYIVLLEPDVVRAAHLARALELDAVSAYAVADGSVVRGSYRQLAGQTEAFWSRAAAAGLPLVPPAMTGWDRRPRVAHPVPWEASASAPPDAQDRFFERPTPEELQTHLTKALRRAALPEVPARMVLVYAWNEFDEGGWLAPTRGEGTGRLDAVRRAVSVVCPVR